MGFATSMPLLFTYSATGISSGLLGAALLSAGLMAAMLRVPVQVVPLAITGLVGFTETVNVDELLLPEATCPTVSHVVPQAACVLMVTAGVTVSAAPLLLLTVTASEVGLFWPTS